MSRLAMSDVVLWTRELAALLRMGYHMPEALARLKGHARGSIRSVLETLEQRTLAGDVLGDAVAKTGAFPPMVVRGLAAARGSSAILETLDHLADMLERDEDRRLGIAGALAYPRFIVAVGALLGWLMLGPVMRVFFGEGMSYAMVYSDWPPHISRFDLFTYAMTTWLCSLPGVAVVLVIVIFLEVVMSGALGTSRWWPWLPLIGNRMRWLDTIGWCDWLNHLLAQGTPLPEAVNLAAESAMSHDFTIRMKRVVRRLEQGGTLSDSLAFERVVPTSAGWLLSQAEAMQFGPSVLERAARCMERGMLERDGRELALLEPLCVVGLGALMGLALLAYFLPLYQAIGSIH